MVVEFESTMNDLINFYLFHRQHSPILQKQTRMARFFAVVIAVPFVFFIIYALCLVFYNTASMILSSSQAVEILPAFAKSIFVILALILSTIFGIYTYLRFPDVNRRQTIQRLQKLYSEGDNKNSFGHCVMTLSSEGIVTKRATTESKMEWSNIIDVNQNESYIFLYISTLNAFVIPKHSFPSESDQQEFLAYIKAQRKSAN